MTIPMLGDFAIRLAGGLAAVLAATPWRVVPPAFFRTHCQVILGLGVLAALVTARPPTDPAVFGLALSMAVLAFAASVAWGLGLPRLGLPIALGIAAVAAVTLCLTTGRGQGESALGIWCLNAASRLASAFLLGSTLTAMLLGHHYLTAPAMSIEPLKRFVRFMAIGLAFRAAFAGVVLARIWLADSPGVVGEPSISPLFLGIRWGMGLLGFGLATLLTWQTVKIRSTQSATGILYIAMTLLLFGELASLILARESRMLI